MEARGRNGYFKVRTVEVVKASGADIFVSLYSQRLGNAPPVMISGTFRELNRLQKDLHNALRKIKVQPYSALSTRWSLP